MSDRKDENLVSQLFRGILWTGLAAFLQFGLGLVQTYLLVRLLDKPDFAAMALIQVYSGLILQWQYAFFQSGIVQQEQIEPGQIRGLLRLSNWIGAGILILSWGAGWILSRQYGGDSMTGLALISGLGLGLNTIGGIHKACLHRDFRYKALFFSELIGFSVYFTLTLLLAYLGYGPFALAIGFAARSGAESLLFRMQNRAIFKKKAVAVQSLGAFFHFGRTHFTERLVTQLVFSLDYLLIGKWLGLEGLGVYDVFKRSLVRPAALVTEALERAVFPVYSRLQGHPWRLRTLYLSLLNAIATIHFPVYAILGICAAGVVRFYFGADWEQYAGVFRWLSVFVIFHALLNPLDHLLLSQGKIVWWTRTSLAYGILTTILIWILKERGLEPVTAGITLAHGALLIFSCLLMVTTLLKGRFSQVGTSVTVPVMTTLLAGLVLIAVVRRIGSGFILPGILVYSGLIVYLNLKLNRIFVKFIKKLRWDKQNQL